MKRFVQMLIEIATFAIVTYVLIMLGMFLLQRSLMYYPARPMNTPNHYAMPDIASATIETQDKLKIEVWYQKPKKNYPLIVYFHGNAGHIGDRSPKLNQFLKAGFGLLGVSYRGYGNSEGKPYEQGLYEDARTAVHYAIQELGHKPETLLIYGESLGSGVATHTAWQMSKMGTPVGGLILEAPYTSVANRSQELYPWIPAYYLVKDKYYSIQKIDQIDAPLLLFHGEEDVVIPVHHGRALLEKAKDPKQGIFFDHVGHTQFPHAVLAEHMVTFAKKHKLIAK